jgi:predicted polyphosphate/ATP-dependent NAD kinase
VIRQVDRDKILIMSTPAKLRDIEGGTLKVDTGDRDVDDLLRGYIRVITDYNELRMVEVE